MSLRVPRGGAPTVTPSTLVGAHVLAREFRHRLTMGSRWTHGRSSRELQSPLRTRASARAKDSIEGVKEERGRGDLQRTKKPARINGLSIDGDAFAKVIFLASELSFRGIFSFLSVNIVTILITVILIMIISLFAHYKYFHFIIIDLLLLLSLF